MSGRLVQLQTDDWQPRKRWHAEILRTDPAEPITTRGESWNEFVESLRGSYSNELLNRVVRLVALFRFRCRSLPEPAIFTRDDHVKLAWKNDQVYAEVDVRTDGAYDWFYRAEDEAGGHSAEDVQRPGDVVNSIVSILPRFAK